MPSRQKLFSWLSRLLILLALLWVATLIYQEGSTIASQFRSANPIWLLISLLLGTISIFFNAPVYYLIINYYAPISVSFYYAIHLNFVSQMIRHVPGRFWGVVYQLNETREHIPAQTLLLVNVDYTLVYLAFNLLIPTAILLFALVGWGLTAVFLAVGLLLFGLGFRLNWPRRLLTLIQAWLPTKFRQRISPYLTYQTTPYPWTTIVLLAASLMLSWGFYLVAWLTFSRVFSGLQTANLPLLAASYALAWFVGFISFITPAGLGIRETTFVLVAQTVTSTAEAGFLAVFVRLWLLVIDIILFFVGIVIKFWHKRKAHVSPTARL